MLILTQLRANKTSSITSLLNTISSETGIPLSTLKFNSRILRDLGLIKFDKKPELTKFGTLVLEIVEGE